MGQSGNQRLAIQAGKGKSKRGKPAPVSGRVGLDPSSSVCPPVSGSFCSITVALAPRSPPPQVPPTPRLRVLGAESEPLSGRASSNSICSSYNGERGSVGIEKESICPPTFLRVRSVPGPVLGAMHTATRTEIAPGPRVHSEPDT